MRSIYDLANVADLFATIGAACLFPLPSGAATPLTSFPAWLSSQIEEGEGQIAQRA